MPRVPTWREIVAFCERNGYERDERSHHTYYTHEPVAGFISQTYISRGAGNTRVPTPLWPRIWRDQLRLGSEDDFWRGLDGEDFHYDLPPAPRPLEPMPPYLTRFLRDTLHYTDEQVAAISPEDAQRMLDTHYSRPSSRKRRFHRWRLGAGGDQRRRTLVPRAAVGRVAAGTVADSVLVAAGFSLPQGSAG